MKEIKLFYGRNAVISNLDIYQSIQSLNAENCDILYVHSSLNFGVPNSQLRKSDLLNALIEVIYSLRVDTIIFPTYTFSFCNNLMYDVELSKTPMGVLNEFFRKQPGVTRSDDPLMSNALYGKNDFLVKNIGFYSCGKDSTFDLLHNTRLRTKFLFLGPVLGDCFTYMHYLESLYNVPYRYEKNFVGQIKKKGIIYNAEYSLFVRYGNVFPGFGSLIYENILLERGTARKKLLGDAAITVVDELDASRIYGELIYSYPNFFIKDVFKEEEKIPHIPVNNMVSL